MHALASSSILVSKLSFDYSSRRNTLDCKRLANHVWQHPAMAQIRELLLRIDPDMRADHVLRPVRAHDAQGYGVLTDHQVIKTRHIHRFVTLERMRIER